MCFVWGVKVDEDEVNGEVEWREGGRGWTYIITRTGKSLAIAKVSDEYKQLATAELLELVFFFFFFSHLAVLSSTGWDLRVTLATHRYTASLEA